METVVILGCGIVGKSWAMLFASAGHEVRLYDTVPQMVKEAPDKIYESMKKLEAKGQLKGKQSAEKQISLIKQYYNLKDALRGATFVQENGPEDLQIKQEIYKNLDEIIREIGNKKVIIGSSTSSLLPSLFTSGLSISENCVVTHPVNPPYFVRLVEIVPSADTNPQILPKIRKIFEDLGMKPVTLKKELGAFALNRIQYAILNETSKLVTEGFLTAEDADTVMKEGLAPRSLRLIEIKENLKLYNFINNINKINRYLLMGPLETSSLNAYGWADYCQRYGKAIAETSNDDLFRKIPDWYSTSEGNKQIAEQIKEQIPNMEERKKWRDDKLADLFAFKNSIGI